MNMQTIKKYLEKLSVSYEVNTYGSSYFDNAEPVMYEGIVCKFDPMNPTDNATAEKVKRYCNRYGFGIFGDFINLYEFGFAIATAADREKSGLYYQFQKQSVIECENLIHEYHVEGTHETKARELNDALKGIMQKYGNAYNRELQTANECAA